MAKENETIEDILAEMRIFKCCNLETGELELCSAIANYFADRLEAAHRRERGDVAKLREAVEKVLEITNKEWDARRETSAMWEIHDICTTALAAPPRNCDKYPTFNDAIRALADKRGWHDAKWDSERYCILVSWLFAPATEKEGGKDADE